MKEKGRDENRIGKILPKILLLFAVTVIMGILFNVTRVTALDSESFEAEPLMVYDIQSLDELQ